MPTLSGMRRRGYPPAAIRRFCDGAGIAKRDNVIQLARLEAAVRDELNRTAPRAMAVLRPLKLVIENYPEGQVEELDAVNNPEDPSAGTRNVPFSRELWIERDDFLEDPPKKFFRLAPGREVRLRYAYFVTCTGVVKDAAGEIVELRCTLRSRDARRRRARRPQGEGHAPLGVGAHAAAGRGAPLRPALLVEDPDGRARRAATSPTTSTPTRSRCCASARVEPSARATPSPARASSSSASATSASTPTSRAGRAGLEPHRHAARHLGEGEPRASEP